MMPCTDSGRASSSPRSFRRRTNCSAYSGFPPARATSSARSSASSTLRSAVRRAVTRRRRRAPPTRSSARSASRLPTPAAAAAARDARCASTSIGTSPLRSTSESTKSSIASSAQCRSSKTQNHRATLGDQLEEAPPRAECLVAAPRCPLASTPSSGCSCRVEPLRFLGIACHAPDSAGELLLDDGRGVGLEDPDLRLHDLRERPERHAVAVGQRPPCAMSSTRLARRGAEQLVDEPRLADPRHAHKRYELRRPTPRERDRAWRRAGRARASARRAASTRCA